MSTIINNQSLWSNHECAICSSKAIGINFGAPTCAPCKAFFRRNARRKEILQLSCQHHEIILSTINNVANNDKKNLYLQIRRCSSCRLRRCFDMGMKGELATKRNIKKKQQEKQLAIPQRVCNNNELLHETDWRHLSNVVSAFDTYCLKSYVQQRKTICNNEIIPTQYGYMPIKSYTALPMSLTISLFSFLRSLPAFHSLSPTNRTYLSKHNLRTLLFINMLELNQSCFSEPWQIALDKATWEVICGPELFEQFVHAEKLAEKLLIADPVITRLWLILLFFSSSIFCIYESDLSAKIPKKKTAIIDIQNAYAELLWNYLLHRYDYLNAVRIFSNLIHVFLKIQLVAFAIGIQVRTRNDLSTTNKTLTQFVTLNIQNS